MSEHLVFPVPEAVAKSALIDEAGYQRLYQQSIEDPDGFWGEAAEGIDWYRKADRVLDADAEPAARPAATQTSRPMAVTTNTSAVGTRPKALASWSPLPSVQPWMAISPER